MGVRSETHRVPWVVQSTAAVTLLAVAAATWFACTQQHAITERELRANVQYLVSERVAGRLPGTSGYDSAAQYATQAFQRGGLTPAYRDSGAAGYQQLVPMVRTHIAPGSGLILRSGRTAKRLAHGQRSFLMISARPGRMTMLESAPIFVGYGVHAPQFGVDDMAGLELAGHPVLLNLSVPDSAELGRMPEPLAALYARTKAAQHRRLDDLISRGASAIMLVPNRWLIDEWDELAARWQRVAYAPAAAALDSTLYSKVPIALLHADLVDRVFMGRKYHPISHAGTYQTFEFPDMTMQLDLDVRALHFASPNVIGLVRGTDRELRGEYVAVAARLDGPGVTGGGISPDATVAAAGSALLEIANAVAHHPPRRSVLFVLFTADVGGRFGVQHFVAHPPVNPANIVAAIQLGELGATHAADKPLIGYADSAFQSAASTAASRWRPKLTLRSAAGAPAFERSAAEMLSRAGVPSLLVTDRAEQRNGRSYDPQLLLSETRNLRAIITSIANARDLAKPAHRHRRSE